MRGLKEKFLKRIQKEIEKNEHLIAVAVGSGLVAKYAMFGGADFLMALNSGIFRGMGRGSLGGLLPYANSNNMVFDFGKRELMPLVKDFPVVFGLNATDPTKDMDTYLDEIMEIGFIGINNYPTIGLFDGHFRKNLEEQGQSYQNEIAVFKKAAAKGMVTVAYVFDGLQAASMIDAGADIICVHLGLTQGGILGAAKALSLVESRKRIDKIFDICERMNPSCIRMFYGGPVKTPTDVQYIYQNTNAQGYIGGSAFDRIPTEKSVISITQDFKQTDHLNEEDLMVKMLKGVTQYYDYVGFVKEYVKENYMNDISFIDLAKVCHVSRSHLSALFRKEVGCSFPEYLVSYRLNMAEKLLKDKTLRISEAAEMVGYQDAAHFSKIFKKYRGISPSEMRNQT